LSNFGDRFVIFMFKKDKELRILILTHAYSNVISGGETVAAWELTKALAQRGIKIYVVSTFVKISKAKPHPNIKIYRVPFSQQARNFNQLDMFKTFLYSWPIIFLKKIDIIHLINTQGPHPFAYFKIKPFVSTADLEWDYQNPKFKNDLFYDKVRKKEEFGLDKKGYGFLDKILNKLAYYFFAFFKFNQLLPKSVDLYACRETKIIDYLKKQNYLSRTVFIPMGVDINKFNPKVEPVFNQKRDFTFLFVGSVAKRKGVEYIIKAFNVLSQRYKNIELLLVGPGAPSTVDYFKKMVIPNAKIRFVGEIVIDALPSYYVYSDVFVGPAIGSRFGIYKVAVEAMACGKPVILSRAYDTEAIGEEFGLWVEPGETDELVKTMEKFLKNPSLVRFKGEKAREYVVKNHSWSLLAGRMEKAYRLILK